MPVLRSGETEFDKEMQKWDTPRRLGGYGPDGFEAFPQMLYKAYRRDSGKVMCLDMDALYSPDMATVARAEAFNQSCLTTVRSQAELDRALDTGWRLTPQAALDHVESLARDVAKAAAEAAYGVQRMSELARREHAALDAATDAPVVDVPAPKRKPGRPAKAAV